MSRPKLYIINYFDSLINKIDIYTEEKLQNLNPDDLVEKPTDLNKEIDRNRWEYYVQDYKIPSIKPLDDENNPEPYVELANFPNITQRPLLFEPEANCSLTLKDYFTRFREALIQELRHIQEETLENYDDLRKNETNIDFKDMSEEEMRKILFEKKFCFIYQFDQKFALAPTFWRFEIFLFVFDFYIDQEMLQFCRFKLEPNFKWIQVEINNDQKIPRKIILNKKQLMGILVEKNIEKLEIFFGYYDCPSAKYLSPVINLKLKELLSLPKFNITTNDSIILEIDNDTYFDFTHLKALEINPKILYNHTFLRNTFEIKSCTASLDCFEINSFKLIQTSLSQFKSLSKIVFKNCDLASLNPEAFECLPILRNLVISNCENYSHIDYRNLPNLISLTVDYIQTKMIKQLSPNLTSLRLRDTWCPPLSVSADFDEFEHPNVKVLRFSQHQITHLRVKMFSGFPLLRHLEISRGKLCRVNLDDECLKQLESLTLSDNHLVSLNKKFAKLNRLKSLDLSGNHGLRLTRMIFKGLENLENLFMNEINQNGRKLQLPPDLFTNLMNLRKLSVSGNRLTQIDLKVFTNMFNLEELDLSNNQIQSIDLGATFKGLINLKFFDLSSNKLIRLNEIGVFSSLVSLEVLNLSYNYMRQIDSGLFNGLDRLERLCLRNNCFGNDFNLEAFHKMLSLRNVDFCEMPNVSRELKQKIIDFYSSRIEFIF